MMENCIVCGNEIYKGKTGNKRRTRRRKGAITCSPKCSKTYGRIATYIMCTYYRKKKRQEIKNGKA